MNYIARWGATLSTILALVKLRELWRDRFRIEVGYLFTGSPEEGNQIHIRNLAKNPIILSNWELLWGEGSWPSKKYSTLAPRQLE